MRISLCLIVIFICFQKDFCIVSFNSTIFQMQINSFKCMFLRSKNEIVLCVHVSVQFMNT